MAATENGTMNYAQPFYVFRLEEVENIFLHRPKAEYYGVSLIANNTPGTATTLCFCHPQSTREAGSLPRKPAGFACLFNAAFLSVRMREIIQSLPMFKKGTTPVYFLNPAQDNYIRELFEKMLAEVNNDYAFKYELLGNYLASIIHHALKIQPAMKE